MEKRRSPGLRLRRDGSALVVVLLILALAMSITYVAVRVETRSTAGGRNRDLRNEAAEAASIGLRAAFAQMHEANWAGVGTSFRRDVSDDVYFEARYVAGDDALAPGDPDYDRKAVRVTIDVEATADPGDGSTSVTRRAKAVVELIPRELAAEPGNWSNLTWRSFTQTDTRSCKVHLGAHIDAKPFFQGKIELSPDYPSDANARGRYLDDLYRMYDDEVGDYRPFAASLSVVWANQSAAYMYEIGTRLQHAISTRGLLSIAADYVHPGAINTYRLYPGGPEYTVPRLAADLTNVALAPDPETNPAGIYYRDGTLTIHDNVTIQGTVICRDELRLDGDNIVMLPAELPSLLGDAGPVVLPVACATRVKIGEGSNRNITGVVAAFSEFKIEQKNAPAELVLKGHVISDKLEIQSVDAYQSADWKKLYKEFNAAVTAGTAGTSYFPVWCDNQRNLPCKPWIVIEADADTYRHHWIGSVDPVYMPHPDDTTDIDATPALRWKVVRWLEDLE
ncbi:MAG: hypothetical protein D6741_01395 [Planctomycetota bacterium]|nr:MAG: hypothetical protein D6741_01395 [Planctomycetota bacterium]